MAIQIHPTALVDKNAQLGEDVEIGPYASVGPDVKIGARTVVQQGAILHGHTTIGDDCQIFPYACIGMKTQDLKYVEGSVSYVEIGNRTVIREFATVHLGTKDGEKTIIGDDCLFMAYCHAAHGVILGNHVICSNSVQLAGDVHIQDWAIVGGCAAAHQVCTIGKHAMVGGMSKINKDIPPYVLCGRDPICYAGVNIVGLRRRGFSSDVIRNIRDIYDTIYFQGYNISDGCAKVEAGFPQSEERDTILNFVKASKRGIIRAYDTYDSKVKSRSHVKGDKVSSR